VKNSTRRKILQDLDLFVLDNSIHESTVGQLRSHTLQNKLENFEQVKKGGIKDIIITSFSHMTIVDGDFVAYGLVSVKKVLHWAMLVLLLQL